MFREAKAVAYPVVIRKRLSDKAPRHKIKQARLVFMKH
jgi:hypothetical protein